MMAAPVIGHRGAAGIAPENTLAAVRVAADHGVRWIEVDAQLSADGRAVVYHDATLERCTNGQGELAAYSHAELTELDAGSWFDRRFAGERVPLLSDLLALCQERHVGINLELKVAEGRDPEALAIAALQDMAAHDAVDVLVSSFSKAALVACRRTDPAVRLGWLCVTWPQDLAAINRELKLVSVHCDEGTLEQRHVEQARALGLKVYAWTVNEPERVQLFQDWGVSGVITDYPQRFVGEMAIE